jgi:hypothetical protein
LGVEVKLLNIITKLSHVLQDLLLHSDDSLGETVTVKEPCHPFRTELEWLDNGMPQPWKEFLVNVLGFFFYHVCFNWNAKISQVVDGFRQVLFHLWILSLSLGSGHQSALSFALIQSCLVVLT